MSRRLLFLGMRKPTFEVVTGVVVLLACIGFVSKYAVDLIPPGPPNRLISEPAEFLQQAAHQAVDWEPLSDQTFAEAAKEERPVMLVIGSACSTYGRAADKFVFSSNDVRAFLNRSFVCARVDTMATPEFQNAFLPISRAAIEPDGARLAIPPDYQVWFFDPKGNLFAHAEDANGPILDPKAFLGVLTDVLDKYGNSKELADLQGQDLAILYSTTAAPPDLGQFAGYLIAASPAAIGGFPVNGRQLLWPSDWQFELEQGSYADYLRSISPCLASPDLDLLDGGFFTTPARLDWHGIGYDKLTVTNASMMQTLAIGSILGQDPSQKEIALATFDWILETSADDGSVAAGQIGDENTIGRSARYSFSPRRLRDLFPNDAEREWVRDAFGLRVESDPQMTPMVADSSLIAKNPKRYQDDLAILHAHRPAPKFAGHSQLDAGGFATARMLRVARILGDSRRLAEAGALFAKLDRFRILDDVVHSTAYGVRTHSYLGDYLAYADAALQEFLATGDQTAFENGLAVLRRAIELYEGTRKGIFRLSPPPGKNAPQEMDVPEIVDNVRESCTAQIIRLCNGYGRLLGDRGDALRTVAADTIVRFAGIAPRLGQYAGGYFCAALEMQDSTYAISVGPNAVAVASALARLAPTRLVAPAVGPVWRPGNEPGIYVVRSGIATGPMSPAQAAADLRPAGQGGASFGDGTLLSSH
ncbi:MAG TPA: DUF255 domain-containing protein [Fimbriimonadaceae bacterium]|nr:DUF255 domain-containing protein [Fimbriimonadaceae bacterium]